MHPVAGAADVEVHFIVTTGLGHPRTRGQIRRNATAQLQCQRVLGVVVTQETLVVAMQDRAAEQKIIDALRKAYPTHGILGEETGLHKGSGEGEDYLWIIDPLDGTTNFLRGIPHFAVSIACKYRGRLEHAVVPRSMAIR